MSEKVYPGIEDKIKKDALRENYGSRHQVSKGNLVAPRGAVRYG